MIAYYDIETGPLPPEELKAIEPRFEAKANLKDPEKIKIDVSEKRDEWYSRAALSAITGRVLAVGILIDRGGLYGNSEVEPHLHIVGGARTEADVIQSIWDLWRSREFEEMQFVGFNSNSFDLPFLCRRSWKLGIEVPPTIRRGRYWHDRFVDIRDIWSCGEFRAEGSLGDIAQFLGVGNKTDSGANFAKLLEVSPEDAAAYLANDLKLTRGVHRALCAPKTLY